MAHSPLRQGFTLVEMAVALAIIGVWIGVVAQFFSHSAATFAQSVRDTDRVLLRAKAIRQQEEDLHSFSRCPDPPFPALSED
jgi:prepilin-type N-terminal cleavage/methylation domain-containing protein